VVLLDERGLNRLAALPPSATTEQLSDMTRTMRRMYLFSPSLAPTSEHKEQPLRQSYSHCCAAQQSYRVTCLGVFVCSVQNKRKPPSGCTFSRATACGRKPTKHKACKTKIQEPVSQDITFRRLALSYIQIIFLTALCASTVSLPNTLASTPTNS
jgi:hypothetical protein